MTDPNEPQSISISFHPDDREFARKLRNALQRLDLHATLILDYGNRTDDSPELAEAIRQSGLMVLLLSPASTASRRLRTQWTTAFNAERQNLSFTVMPALLDDVTLPTDMPSNRYVDFRHHQSPGVFEAGVELIRNLSVRKTASNAAPQMLEAVRLEVPSDLIESCLSGDSVLFAGAGLSARAGVSTWTQFLRDLLELARRETIIDDSYALSLKGALDVNERDAAADGIVQMFESRRDLLQSFLKEYFAPARALSPAHHTLARLPFSAIITVNYDRLLEETFPDYAAEGVFTPKDAEPLLDALAQKRRFILKLYGLIERLDTLIFAPIEYREALSSNISFAKFMEGIFFSRTFFFVGLSLEGIQDFLSGFVFRGTSPRKHFALVAATGSAWEAKARFLRNRYNIEVIRFPESPTCPEVGEFLDELAAAVDARTQHQSTLPPPSQLMPGIRRLVLKDIGPFEKLSLDFSADHTWKVLLGDNGVGKSTILKAIAVAVLGSDARSYAGRIVRTGRTKGSITLYTVQNPASGYVTEILLKDKLTEAEVLSFPSRPMEAEGWLALGFSPLRVVSWNKTSGPQAMIQKGRPSADDLLPLISGEADPRMDSLKQWIVNLDSADEAGKMRVLLGHTDRITSLAFAPDGRTLYSASIDGTFRTWDVARLEQLSLTKPHDAGINCMVLSRDGKCFATASLDRTAKTWVYDTAPRRYIGSQSQILSLAISSDNSLLITVSESGGVRLWNTMTKGGAGQELRRIDGETIAAWCVALNPDDSLIAVGRYDGTIRLLHVASGTQGGVLVVGSGAILGLAFTPDGQYLVAASQNGPVSLWRVEYVQRVHDFIGNDARCVAISPDGSTVVAGFQSGEIRAWDLQSTAEVFHVFAHPDCVWSVAFSPDGRTIASGSQDRSIKLWSLTASVDLKPSNEQETIRRFFHLIAELTDRPDVSFLHVTKDYRVMVRTADAPDGISLEMLSQGMTSLFGWIGVLCQRMKETLQVSSQDPLPTNGYALVLIDELDAHMHPKWQQKLVFGLKKVFPNVQFIACTHSPLVIAGLDAEQVERFALVDGKTTSVKFEPDMTLGRTDQILTGELFGLQSTLDMQTQSVIGQYEDLLGEPDRTAEQEALFTELGNQLEQRIPNSSPTLVGRRAGELLQAMGEIDSTKLPQSITASMIKLSNALGDEQ